MIKQHTLWFVNDVAARESMWRFWSLTVLSIPSLQSRAGNTDVLVNFRTSQNTPNVWCIKNCTKLSNVLLLRLVQFLMHQTLVGTLLTASEFFKSFSGVITKVQDSDRITIGIISWIHLSWLSKHLLFNLTIFKK